LFLKKDETKFPSRGRGIRRGLVLQSGGREQNLIIEERRKK
jgi:hypothetical protein